MTPQGFFASLARNIPRIGLLYAGCLLRSLWDYPDVHEQLRREHECPCPVEHRIDDDLDTPYRP